METLNTPAEHRIFLSHSGQQKGFARDLYNRLSTYYYDDDFIFFDQEHHSLPPGQPFPPLILSAANTCNLAIVVLSHDFLSSRWPMIELCAFADRLRSPTDGHSSEVGFTLLPLFLKLSPDDVKKQENLDRWRKTWEDFAQKDGRFIASNCERAVTKVCSLNGILRRPESEQGEASYLEAVVDKIRRILPPPLENPPDPTNEYAGIDRLCKVILDKFGELEETRSSSMQACILGMYGVPGTGKSTLCRCLCACESMFREFSGNVVHLDLHTECDSHANKVSLIKDQLSPKLFSMFNIYVRDVASMDLNAVLRRLIQARSVKNGSAIFLNTFFNIRLLRVAAAEHPSTPSAPVLPLVVNTWANPGFPRATDEAWSTIQNGGSRLDALVAGCSACERLQCDYTVGYGGSPDESGETTLDALIMDGPQHRMGAVADLRHVKDASRVARAVMEHTTHSILAGESATKFAIEMGFKHDDLATNTSRSMWKKWITADCQPNFRQNVFPDPTKSCGPYRPKKAGEKERTIQRRINTKGSMDSHDTIGMVIVDQNGDIVAGTSTNGASHKIPGRVGDGPIPGAGAYVDNEVGGAAGTGDGDVMMRFLPSYQAVESMRQGMDPGSAAADAIRRIAKYYPNFQGALVAANKRGQYGAACHGIGNFSYCVRNPSNETSVQVVTVACVDASN